MINAAMMIAPAPQMGNIQSGGKAAAGQGQLFDQAMAQQEQQAVYQTEDQDQSGLSGLSERDILMSNFVELSGNDIGQLFEELLPEQQDLLEQLEPLDMALLDALTLLFEQGMTPNSMDPDKLQQLVDLVEDVLPGWQVHSQEMVAESDSGQELLPEQQDPALEQKVEELIAWFSQYQEQTQIPSGKEIGGELPSGQLVGAQKLAEVRERLTQLRAALSEAGNDSDAAKAEGEAKGNQMATAVSRGAELSAHRESSEAPLETRFSELLKPRQSQTGQPQTGQPQTVASDRQVQQVPTDQSPTAGSVEELFTKIVDKGTSQVPTIQAAMNAKPMVDGAIPQHNHLHGQPAPVATAAQAITAPAAVAAPFAASQQIADNQIFDQVVTHLSGSDKGDMGRMVLRLHPAELGSLRIELMVEGDRVRANLHAQSQQVQEVLERNLGQLRNALAEQGLKIDHFQVSSDARQNQQQGQREDLAREYRQADQSPRSNRDKDEQLPENQAIPLAHLTRNGGRGISLHV